MHTEANSSKQYLGERTMKIVMRRSGEPRLTVGTVQVPGSANELKPYIAVESADFSTCFETSLSREKLREFVVNCNRVLDSLGSDHTPYTLSRVGGADGS